MKKKYERPYLMKLDIDDTNVLVDSTSVCDENELNAVKGNKNKDTCITTVGYMDDGDITFF